jgi:hypothetical protein
VKFRAISPQKHTEIARKSLAVFFSAFETLYLRAFPDKSHQMVATLMLGIKATDLQISRQTD